MNDITLVPRRATNHSIELYENVLRDYLASIRDSPPTYERFPNTDKLAIIIEPRYDDITIAVLYNFMHFMARDDSEQSDKSFGWNFMILSHKMYETEIRKRFPNILFVAIEDKYIEMSVAGIPNISVQSYNTILLSKQFWEKTIPSKYERICIFQRDCIMYRPIPREFEQYMFAGASYGDINSDTHFLKSTTFYNGGINGGFSLRFKHCMISCIYTITHEAILNYRNAQKTILYSVYEGMYNLSQKKYVDFNILLENEDVFFANACEILGYLMPDILHRNMLSVEMQSGSYFSKTPSVYHGWNKGYQSKDIALKYLKESELFSQFAHEQEVNILVEKDKMHPTCKIPDDLCD